jgi:hypothetical protein
MKLIGDVCVRSVEAHVISCPIAYRSMTVSQKTEKRTSGKERH